MAYSIALANRLRRYLHALPDLKIDEKKMFRGLAFLVNGKMCVNVSGKNLMCRFDPEAEQEVSGKVGFQPMMMKGRKLQGYCYVSGDGYKSNANFEYWLKLCLDFNKKAKASKKKRSTAK